MATKLYPTLKEIYNAFSPRREYVRYLPIARYILYPVSFLLTWLAIRIGLTTETTAWLSGFVGLMGYLCLLSNQEYLLPIGIGLFVIFNILDCVDGSIARTMKTQNPYGKYLDILMGWIDMGFWAAIGVMAYRHQGLLYGIGPLDYGPVFWLAVGGLTCYFSNLIKYIEKCFDNCMRNDWENLRTKNDTDVMDNKEKQKIKAASHSKKDFSPVSSILRRVNHNLRVRETTYFLLILAYLCNTIDLLLITYLFYYFMHTIILVIIYSIRGRQLLRSRYKR